MTGPLDGLLLVDKPAGPTSHDVVDRARRILGQRRIGHAGTLDPPATGLLPLVLGRATRLVRFLPHSPKWYRGTLRLGVRTTTDDAAGEEVERHSGPLPHAGRVLEAARGLVGELRQVPPAVSARKVGGRRLYRLAREGIAAEAPAAPVVVHAFDLAATDRDDEYRFEAEVSAGTYVRALARDLGAALGCGAALDSLERTRIGPFRLDRAIALDGDDARDRALGALIPIDEMPLEPPSVRLADPEAARRFAGGARVPAGPGGPEGPCRVVAPDGRVLGVGERSAGWLLPRVVVAEGRGPGRSGSR